MTTHRDAKGRPLVAVTGLGVVAEEIVLDGVAHAQSP